MVSPAESARLGRWLKNLELPKTKDELTTWHAPMGVIRWMEAQLKQADSQPVTSQTEVLVGADD